MSMWLPAAAVADTADTADMATLTHFESLSLLSRQLMDHEAFQTLLATKRGCKLSPDDEEFIAQLTSEEVAKAWVVVNEGEEWERSLEHMKQVRKQSQIVPQQAQQSSAAPCSKEVTECSNLDVEVTMMIETEETISQMAQHPNAPLRMVAQPLNFDNMTPEPPQNSKPIEGETENGFNIEVDQIPKANSQETNVVAEKATTSDAAVLPDIMNKETISAVFVDDKVKFDATSVAELKAHTIVEAPIQTGLIVKLQTRCDINEAANASFCVVAEDTLDSNVVLTCKAKFDNPGDVEVEATRRCSTAANDEATPPHDAAIVVATRSNVAAETSNIDAITMNETQTDAIVAMETTSTSIVGSPVEADMVVDTKAECNPILPTKAQAGPLIECDVKCPTVFEAQAKLDDVVGAKSTEDCTLGPTDTVDAMHEDQCFVQVLQEEPCPLLDEMFDEEDNNRIDVSSWRRPRFPEYELVQDMIKCTNCLAEMEGECSISDPVSDEAPAAPLQRAARGAAPPTFVSPVSGPVSDDAPAAPMIQRATHGAASPSSPNLFSVFQADGTRFCIFVLAQGRTISVDAYPDCTIALVRQQITKKLGLPCPGVSYGLVLCYTLFGDRSLIQCSGVQPIFSIFSSFGAFPVGTYAVSLTAVIDVVLPALAPPCGIPLGQCASVKTILSSSNPSNVALDQPVAKPSVWRYSPPPFPPTTQQLLVSVSDTVSDDAPAAPLIQGATHGAASPSFPNLSSVFMADGTSFCIFVLAQGRTVAVDAYPDCTIALVRQQITKKLGLPCSGVSYGLVLCYAGKRLAEDKTVADYGIGKDATLFLTCRVLGGGKDLQATKAHIQALNEARLSTWTDFHNFTQQSPDVSRSPGGKRQNLGKQAEELYGKCAAVTNQFHTLFQNWTDDNFLAMKDQIDTLAGELDCVIKKISEKGSRADVTPLRQQQFELMQELNTIWEDLVSGCLSMTEEQFQKIAQEFSMEPAKPSPQRSTPVKPAQTSPKPGAAPAATRSATVSRQLVVSPQGPKSSAVPKIGGFSAENEGAVRAARSALEASHAPASRPRLVQVEQQLLMLQFDLDGATGVLQSTTLFDCEHESRSWRLLQSVHSENDLEDLLSAEDEHRLVFILKKEELDEFTAMLTSSKLISCLDPARLDLLIEVRPDDQLYDVAHGLVRRLPFTPHTIAKPSRTLAVQDAGNLGVQFMVVRATRKSMLEGIYPNIVLSRFMPLGTIFASAAVTLPAPDPNLRTLHIEESKMTDCFKLLSLRGSQCHNTPGRVWSQQTKTNTRMLQAVLTPTQRGAVMSRFGQTDHFALMTPGEVSGTALGPCSLVVGIFYRREQKDARAKHLWWNVHKCLNTYFSDSSRWRLQLTGFNKVRLGIVGDADSTVFVREVAVELKAHGFNLKDERTGEWLGDGAGGSDNESRASTASDSSVGSASHSTSMVLYDVPFWIIREEEVVALARSVGVMATCASYLSFNPGLRDSTAWRLTGIDGSPRSKILHDATNNVSMFLITLGEYSKLRTAIRETRTSMKAAPKAV